MNDRYLHTSHCNDVEVMYISESIPGPSDQTLEGDELVENFNSQLMHSCKCIDKCLPAKCECLKLSGGENYTLIQEQSRSGAYTVINRKGNSLSSYPIVECNVLCQCSERCGNRIVQYGPISTLYVKSGQNAKKGLGLFTNTLIQEGRFVCEYAGEVLSKKQAEIRYHQNPYLCKMNYIFCLNEHVAGNIIQTYIDPSKFGNIGRYINHSCDPNCVVVPVRVNSPIPKLAVFSVSDIQPDIEITFDYGPNEATHVSDESKRREPCLCESSKCRGFLPSLPC